MLTEWNARDWATLFQHGPSIGAGLVYHRDARVCGAYRIVVGAQTGCGVLEDQLQRLGRDRVLLVSLVDHQTIVAAGADGGDSLCNQRRLDACPGAEKAARVVSVEDLDLPPARPGCAHDIEIEMARDAE